MLNFLHHPIHHSPPTQPDDACDGGETRRRALVAGVGAIGALGVTSLVTAPEAAAATIAQQDLATALGFWPILSKTPPVSPTQYGVPVLWLQQAGLLSTVATIPREPAWNDAKATFTVPTGGVGIQYTDSSGTVLTPGATVAGPTPLPSKVVITASALPGYTLPAAYSWTHWFPNPNLRTMLATDSFAGTDGSSLANRALDNKLGGTKAFKWLPTDVGNFLVLSGGTAVNTATPGWYKCDTGSRNHRVTFDVKWLSPSTTDGVRTPLDISIGGGGPSRTDLGSVSLSVGPARWLMGYVNASGGSTSLTGAWATMPNGTYVVEIFENQVGVQLPGMASMAYYDVAYVDPEKGVAPAARGSLIALRSTETYANAPAALDNVKIESIGGI